MSGIPRFCAATTNRKHKRNIQSAFLVILVGLVISTVKDLSNYVNYLD
ncbi:hypothetical protein HMPREF0577_0530 [Mobiluncus mulieris ATCC 35243]|nr:hypothetical protein HMPREF0577_0530 [Mobiluncus mulieris ATCC 35243]